MKLRPFEIATLVLVLVSFVVGLYFYPQLPATVATHWNAAGQVNGYMTRFWGTFFEPLISLACLALLVIVPRIDPKKENIKQFQTTYDMVVFSILAFLFYVYALSLAWNLGQPINFMQWIIPAFAVLFFIIGRLLAEAKPNWTIGIRTPWTLSNDKVWYKTHAQASVLYQVAAVISLLGIFMPNYGIWFLLVPILGVSLWSVIYSYFVYQQVTQH